MTARQSAELLVLAALWGASFLFMRVAAGEFGPLALATVRVAVAALVLLPLALWHGRAAELRRHWRAIAVVGMASSALPFVAFSHAALAITAGLSSIFNATVPLWGAVVAWAWLRERPRAARASGLAIGFAGVIGLGWDKASFVAADAPGGVGSGSAVAACIVATALYGFGANYTRQRLAGVSPLTVAAGSQVAAALALALPAALAWPASSPSAPAWGAAALLGVLCTGLAYLLFFRLIGQVGPAQAMTVTYLIPLFGVFWGWIALGEAVTPAMAGWGAVILVGTAIASDVFAARRPAAARAD